jgi:hypothetical protein
MGAIRTHLAVGQPCPSCLPVCVCVCVCVCVWVTPPVPVAPLQWVVNINKATPPTDHTHPLTTSIWTRQ